MNTPNAPNREGGLHLLSTMTGIMLWSTSFVATKMAYESFSPLTLGACRFIIASLALTMLVRIWGGFIIPPAKDLLLLSVSGLLGITLYFAMENIGVNMTSASNAALIVASYPAITILLERCCYGISISWVKGVGIALAAIGVYIISISTSDAGGERQLLGNIILIATGIVWALYNFATRSVINKYPAITVSFYQTIAGTIAFIPLAAIEYPEWRLPSTQSWLVLLYLGLFCSVAAFMLYNYGLRRLSAGAAVTLMNLVPVFGVIFSVLLLDESVHASQLLGGIIVIVGVIASVRP